MAEIDEMGRWKCEAPGCKAAATHEYFWLGRPVVVCVLHMETAVELAKTINYREVEATMRAIPPDKPIEVVVLRPSRSDRFNDLMEYNTSE